MWYLNKRQLTCPCCQMQILQGPHPIALTAKLRTNTSTPSSGISMEGLSGPLWFFLTVPHVETTTFFFREASAHLGPQTRPRPLLHSQCVSLFMALPSFCLAVDAFTYLSAYFSTQTVSQTTHRRASEGKDRAYLSLQSCEC